MQQSRLGRDPIPDETTTLNLRDLLKDHGLSKTAFEAVKRSSKKGNQWYLGMKAHVGVDASGLLPRPA